MHGFPLAIKGWVLSWTVAVLAAAGATNDIDVDGVTLHVPTPPGFVAILRSQGALSGYFDEAFPPRLGYRRLASFVPENALPLEASRIASLSRIIHLQVSEDAGHGPVTPAIFADHAKRVEAAIASNNRAPDMGDSGGAATPSAAGQRPNHSRMDVVAYAPHEASPRHFAFSNLYRLAGTETSGRAYGSSSTIAHVLADGMILVASVVGEPGDLAWTQTVSKDWTAALLRANPEAAPAVEAVSRPTADEKAEPRRPRGEMALPGSNVAAPVPPQKP
jgi:hypothetical protein